MTGRASQAWLALTLALMLSSAAEICRADELRTAMRQAIEVLRFTGELSVADVDVASRELIAAFYESRGFAPAWTRDEQIDSLYAAVEASFDKGFNPVDYHQDKAELARAALREDPAPHVRVAIDIGLTDALIRLGYHHRFGKVNPYSLDPHWNFVRALTDGDPVEMIQDAIVEADIERTLDTLFPQVPMYSQLQQALIDHRKLAAAGGWPRIPGGRMIRPGGTDARLPVVVERLLVSGDLAEPQSNAGTYDATIQAAVRAFQYRHGLDEDAVIGPATLAAMNVPVERRIEQLRASLERARWVAHRIPDDYIAVNIAGFTARLVRDGQIAWETRVQVGSEYHKTPVFRGDMKYVVLRPTWTVPYSIATREMLPRIKREPEYFATRDFDIKDRKGRLVDPDDIDWQSLSARGFPYTFVQRPGPRNALGQVKFIFPNRHSVYLHDTPSKALFEKAERAFSHGCIRVDRPLELAALLLEDRGWDRARIDANTETETVFLEQPLPVAILYWTADVLPDGRVRFFNDVYDRDRKLLAALAAPFTVDLPETEPDPNELQER